MKIENMEDEFIRYTSNITADDGGGGCWYGKVRETSGDEVHINGCWHLITSIEVLEVLNIFS